MHCPGIGKFPSSVQMNCPGVVDGLGGRVVVPRVKRIKLEIFTILKPILILRQETASGNEQSRVSGSKRF